MAPKFRFGRHLHIWLENSLPSIYIEFTRDITTMFFRYSGVPTPSESSSVVRVTGGCLIFGRNDFRFFLTTSKDMTGRLYTLYPVEGYRPKTFAGHRDAVLNAYFSADHKSVRPRTRV